MAELARRRGRKIRVFVNAGAYARAHEGEFKSYTTNLGFENGSQRRNAEPPNISSRTQVKHQGSPVRNIRANLTVNSTNMRAS